MNAHEEIAATLRRLSEAWRERRYADLGELFADDVVGAAPGFVARSEGREAMVRSFRDFMDRATIDRYTEGPPEIDIWDDVAIAHHRWEMEWTLGSQKESASGHGAFALKRDSSDDRWKII